MLCCIWVSDVELWGLFFVLFSPLHPMVNPQALSCKYKVPNPQATAPNLEITELSLDLIPEPCSLKGHVLV